MQQFGVGHAEPEGCLQQVNMSFHLVNVGSSCDDAKFVSLVEDEVWIAREEIIVLATRDECIPRESEMRHGPNCGE